MREVLPRCSYDAWFNIKQMTSAKHMVPIGLARLQGLSNSRSIGMQQ